MSEERKKAAPKPIVKVEPKKRVEPKPVANVEPKKRVEPKPVVEPKIELNTEEKSETKTKRAENKYVRVALDAKAEERNQFTTKVKNGELKYAYYATDNDKGYHYYLVLKK